MFIGNVVATPNSRSKACDLGHKCAVCFSVNVCTEHKCVWDSMGLSLLKSSTNNIEKSNEQHPKMHAGGKSCQHPGSMSEFTVEWSETVRTA
jgi:hypothetical protein